MSRRSLLYRSPSPTSALSIRTMQAAPGPWRSIQHWRDRLSGRAPTGAACVTRLLAAVYTDIVGYSRLFAQDDSGTVARLEQLRRDWIRPALQRHHGVLVQTAGDSMLIIFESVAQAVKSAVAIQQGLQIHNAAWPPERRMRLRIGVDLGDIIMDGMDYHGDGVIVAARLQAVCPPGGVCVSRAVLERGAERLGLRSDALGPLALKNLSRPVEAFVLWPPRHEPAPVIAITQPAGA